VSYALPDEPRGAIRPELAVSALWPLLTLMLVGPLAGFVWLAFNSWALGCRHAVRHSVIAVVMIPATGLSVHGLAFVAQAWLEPAVPDHAVLALKLGLIAVQTIALGLAFWIMWNQDEAEQWRKTFGPEIGNGARLFAPLFIARIFLGGHVPAQVHIFAFWTGG